MRMKSLLTLFCVFSLQTLNALAQQRQLPLPVEEALAALHFAIFTPVDLSPDGKWVAYALQDDRRKKKPADGYADVHFSHTGVLTLALGCDIWVTDTQSGESKNLTEGKGSSWDPVWSPDGNYLAFYSDRGGMAHLWLWERETDKLRQISEEIVHPFYISETARWSADGRNILLKILPEGMTIEGARNAIVSPRDMETPGVNSPTVLVYRSSMGQKTATGDSSHDKNDLIRNRVRADLALIEVATGKVRRIAMGFSPAWYDFSPDGTNIAFTSIKGYQSQQSLQLVHDLAVASLLDARPRIIAPDILLDYTALGMTVSWSPDGKRLSYITSDSSEAVKSACFIVPAEGGEPRNVTATLPSLNSFRHAPLWDATGEYIYLLGPNSIWQINAKENKAKTPAIIPDRKIIEAVAPSGEGRFWSPDGGRSMIVVTRDERTKQEGFYQIDLTTGKQTTLLEESKSYGYSPIFNMDVSTDGKKVVFVAEDAGHSAEVWMAGVDFKNSKQVTHTNPQLAKYAMGASRVIEWQSLDGETMRGALLLPPDYQAGKRYPLIVKIYPSDNLSNYVNNFGLNNAKVGVENMQLFATRGYAVLLADSFQPKADPMRGIAKTVLPGISKLVELGIADPDRLGVMGHSNGGWATLALIVQTTRFKAAVSRAGAGNRIGHYGQLARDGSSRGVAIQEEARGMGGPPWQYPNKYIEDSSVFYLDRVQTPLLIVHGSEDNVVPSFLADEVFVGLRRLGKEVEYAKYEGEGHWEGTWGYVNQVDYLNRVIGWFDRWLKAPNPKSKAPEQ